MWKNIVNFVFYFSNSSKDIVNFLCLMKEKYPEFYSVKISREESKGISIKFDDIYLNNDNDF